MFVPPGFGQQSIVTKLGRMVYYTAVSTPWSDADGVRSGERTLVFFHGFGGGSSAYEVSRQIRAIKLIALIFDLF